MLELVIAGSMLALVMTSLSVVMRTSRQSWEAGDNDYAMLAQAHAVSRHFVRAAREAEAVESLSAGGRGITLRMRDGSTTSWQWQATGTDGMTGVVDVHPSAEKSAIALAYDIDNLNFVGYDADGVTVVIAPDDIYLIEVTVEVVLPRGDSARQRIRSKVWIRSW